ncbi:MAG: 4Fe-4S binding protein [Bacteroidaceae bacterium]|nr:4Fe-4S binding protein [Bacteroidaceae bacterium]
MKQQRKKWSDYLWIVSATYFTLGFFNIVFAWLGVICFLIPLLMAIFGGTKGYCNNYCGRGQLFLLIGNTLKLSRRRLAPRWLSSRWFRNGFLVFFLFFFVQMVYITVLVAQGASSLSETIHLLWTFHVPWHWAYPVAVEPWRAQFAFGLYGIMLTSLIVGVLLTVFFRPRTWCVFCPMGNMTQMICKAKNKQYDGK